MRWLLADLPLWKKALGSLVGGSLVLWGILGLPVDFSARAASLRGAVPAWILLSAGLLLVALIWGPSWWHSIKVATATAAPTSLDSPNKLPSEVKPLSAINAE